VLQKQTSSRKTAELDESQNKDLLDEIDTLKNTNQMLRIQLERYKEVQDHESEAEEHHPFDKEAFEKEV
jgi:aspartate carbamoyltransferase catalytic subunit